VHSLAQLGDRAAFTSLIRHADVVDVLWLLLAISICVLLAWLGIRIEPHWVSRDGCRFLCGGQTLSVQGEPMARWRETRVIVGTNGNLQVDQKRFMRRTSSSWTVEGESPTPPRGKRVFLLRGHDEKGQAILLALRMPAKSRAVTILEPLLPRSSRRSTSPATGD
jgi:hypothetical protein